MAASRAMAAWSGTGSVGHHARRPRTDWCLGGAHPAQLQDSNMKKLMIHDALELRICSSELTNIGSCPSVYLIGREPRTMPLKFRAIIALSACIEHAKK